MTNFLLLATVFLSCGGASANLFHQTATPTVEPPTVATPTAEPSMEPSMEPASSKFIKFDVAMLDGTDSKEGSFIVQTRPDWAPIGVARVEELTLVQFWDRCRIYRVTEKFAQFGINGDPDYQHHMHTHLHDDKVRHTNARGVVTFANEGPTSRTTQLFINLQDNRLMDDMGYSPVGEVVSGMDVVDRFYAGYGDVFPKNDIGPHTHKIEEQGNEYLSNEFPLLSYFTGQVLSRKMIFCTWMTNMYLIMNVKACKLLQTLSSLN